MTVPTAALGQSLPSDPEADSPSGVVYELPVDRARKDAAPHREASNRESSGGSSTTSSGDSATVAGVSAGSIRSENNFGTSSQVPGAPKKHKRSDEGNGGAAAGGGGSGGSGGSAVDRVAGVAASSATAQGPSDGVVFPLLAVLLAVGAGIGVIAGRRSLRGRS